jgi:hypothetical protein
VPHGQNQILSTFVQLATTSGRDIKLTADHLIAAGMCNTQGPLPLIKAMSVRVGDCARTLNGLEEISSINSVMGSGLYTVVTTKPLIIVNGFVASPFAVNHSIGYSIYSLLRAVYILVPGFLASVRFVKAFEILSDGVRSLQF